MATSKQYQCITSGEGCAVQHDTPKKMVITPHHNHTALITFVTTLATDIPKEHHTWVIVCRAGS